MAENDPFKEQNIQTLEFPIQDNTRFGSDILRAVKEFQVGNGNTVFRANESGIWLGSSKFANAPFRVDMNGNMVASSVTLIGYVPVGGAATDIDTHSTTISGGKITAFSITANKISVANLSSISADIGTITAGTITGAIIQTALTGYRLKMNGPGNAYEFLFDNSVMATLKSEFIPQSGTGGVSLRGSLSLASLYLSETGEFMGDNTIGLTTPGGSFAVVYNILGASIIRTNLPFEANIIPSVNAAYDLGTAALKWATIYASTISGLSTLTVASTITITGVGFNRNGFGQPLVHCGYIDGSVTGTIISKTNSSGWSSVKVSVGRYTVTHSLGSAAYTVQLTAYAASGAGAAIAKLSDISLNTFEVIVFDQTGTPVDKDFMFALLKV